MLTHQLRAEGEAIYPRTQRLLVDCFATLAMTKKGAFCPRAVNSQTVGIRRVAGAAFREMPRFFQSFLRHPYVFAGMTSEMRERTGKTGMTMGMADARVLTA